MSYAATNSRGTTISVGSGETDDFTPVELLMVAIGGLLLGVGQALVDGLREVAVLRDLAQLLGDLGLLALGVLGLVRGRGGRLLLFGLDLLDVPFGGLEVLDPLGPGVRF